MKKMKKLMMAVAAFGMLLTSCQNDLDFVQNAGETSTVSFSVGTPEIATRAYSDGLTAKVLQYAVYDSEGNILSDLTETDATINGSTTVNLQLTTGDSYAVIFWAAAENAPYTVNFDTKTMTVSYDGAKSNDEARDAFFKYHTFTVKGAQTETIELKRPFAQLNIGAADYAASASAGYTPTQSAVVVKNVYSTLNLASGAVSDDVVAEFALADIKKDETFPVAGYEYMAMNYLLVPTDKEVVDIEFTYTDANNDAKTRTVGSVPVQRNHRTNIYGNLLTSDVDINVEIKPEYIDSHDAVLQMAAAFGGEVTLTEDIVLEAPLKVSSNLTINLNGKTLSGAVAKGAGAVVDIAQGTTVEIVGGTIKSTNENGDAAINNAGTLVLENVTIEGAPLADGGYSAYAVISSGNLVIEEGTTVSADRGCLKFSGAGETVINGGHFTNNDIGTRTLTSHVVDVEDGGTHKLTINGGTFEHLHSATSGSVVICNRTRGTVYVNGGNFSGGNYYGNDNLSDYGYGGTFAVTGGVYTANPAARYLVAGYKSVVKDGVYHVIANDTELVSSSAQFNDALSAGQNVKLATDIDFGTTQLVLDNVKIDLNGKTLTTQMAYGGISLKNGASIKNGTIEHTSTVAAIKAFNVGTIEDVTIKCSCTTLNKVVTGIAVQQGGYVGTIKNVHIEGASQCIEVPYQATVDLIENVSVEGSTNGTAVGQGLLINGGKVVKAVNSSFKGDDYGVQMLLKGVFAVGLELVNCNVTGTTASIYAWDEKGISNTSGSLTLTYDAATTLNGPLTWDFEDECLSVVTLNKPN